MSSDIFGLMNDMGKATYQTSRQWAELNARTVDRLLQQQMSTIESSVEQGFGAVRRAMQAKDLAELLSVQADTAQEMAKTAVTQSRKTVEVLGETRDAMDTLFHETVEKASEEISKAQVHKPA